MPILINRNHEKFDYPESIDLILNFPVKHLETKFVPTIENLNFLITSIFSRDTEILLKRIE